MEKKIKQNLGNNDHGGQGEIVIYQSEDGLVKLKTKISDDTIWLTQAQLVELYGSSKANVSEHIKHIIEEGELSETAVVRNFRTTAADGKTYNTKYYNLDMIISLGYRIKSSIATAFRIWATRVLKEYMIKGFTMDDDRLKGNAGGDYWKELLDRIRDIRSSEKVLYRQVLDLYATAIDYDPKAKESLRFFKIVQNKLHYAAHGHTAAEVIYERANATKPFMGLTAFHGKFPSLQDAKVAKNYLTEDELKILNNLVSGYFDFAEISAIEHRAMRMEDYINQLNTILASGGRKLLDNPGKVSHDEAIKKATKEYRKFELENPSPVEKAYLDSLISVEKTIKANNKKVADASV
ncbi:virulence RhuM family protein [Candidatus Saccharibacteria bacterium]|nr:virulence RhuM family protein [Candidatus Saccharibacteria bacterium]